MAILQRRRTVFSLSNSEVMSNSAPTTEAGITKSEGHDGFFIYSGKAFTLWFKDQGGSWSSYNTYNSADLSDGVAFSWGDNTAAFIQTNEVAHSIAVFIIETKEVGQYKNVENRTLNEAGFGRLDIHSNYKRVRMQNSGHTGEAYAIAIFDENGEAAYVSAPPSGQREGKALGWDENGNLGWITLAAAQILTSFNDAVIDGNTITLDGNGDYVVYNGEFRYTDQFTISTWFKADPNMTDPYIIFSSHDAGGVSNGTVVSMNTSGVLRARLPDSGTGNTGVEENIGTGLNDGNWHQLVVSWEASTTGGRKIYVDGQLLRETNSGAANAYRTTPQSLLYIGGIWNYVTNQFSTSNWFKGQIANFSIVNSITTAQEVADDYANNDLTPAPVEPSLVAYNDAVVDGDTITLDGDGDYVVYDGPFRYSDQFTISTWFKSNGNMANLDTIFSNHDGGGVANGNTVTLNTDGTLNVKTLDSGTGTNGDALNIGSNLADGNWHQLVLTWQASTTNGRKVYVDGQLIHQNTSGAPKAWRTDPGSKTYIGALWLYTTNQLLPNNFFNGQIKSFNIVNSITTAQEVADDYANNNPTPFVPVEVPAPDVYFDGSSTTAQIGNQTLTLQTGVSLGTGNGKYDTNFINYGASGMTNTALLNDGIDLSTGVYTFSLWFYNKRNGDDIELVLRQHVDLSNPPASTNYPIVIRPTAISAGATVAQELGVYKRVGSTNTFHGTGFSMSGYAGLSEWTHLAVVADGSTSKFYVNGQKVGNDVAAVINIVVRQLGSYSIGYQTFAEGIDEFAYWDSALSAAQVATIYNSSEKLSALAPVQEPSNSLPTPDFYLDGSSTETQIGNNTIGLGGATLSTSNGKYDTNSFSFGASGNKAPIRIGTDLDLSTGVYTFSLWFYNKRGGSDWGSVFRQTSGGNPGTTANYPIMTKNSDNILGMLKRENNTNTFYSTGYDMTSFEGNTNWNHLVVVADGTNSTFYINGVQAGSAIAKVITTSVGEIGAYDGNDTQVFAEGLDEIAYWGSALTADQVAEIYNSSVKLSEM